MNGCGVIRQQVGEVRTMRLNYEPGMDVGERLTADPTVSVSRSTGTGTLPSAAGMARNAASNRATFRLSTPSAGTFIVRATGTTSESQQLIIESALVVD